jgi:hypothetical protein
MTSGELTIKFASDMPTAAVDVVSPDLEILKRVMLSPGRSASVLAVPDASFLRVHLPSGQVVILKDPGNLEREVSLQKIQRPVLESPSLVDEGEGSSLSEIHRYYRDLQIYSPTSGEASAPVLEDPVLLHPHSRTIVDATVRLNRRGEYIPGEGFPREARWQLPCDARQTPLVLTIGFGGQLDTRLDLRLPGSAERIWTRADRLRFDEFRDGPDVNFSVRIATSESSADTIASYLQRGDLYSAQAMLQWIDEAEELLFKKWTDPYAAAIGAYLLLRLKQFNRMHDWARNLANNFDFLPDGCIIWAWQLIHQHPHNENEIRKYLSMAVDRGLPVYSEGLRLLIDGLRLMGSDSAAARNNLIKSTQFVVWSSPFTALLTVEPGTLPTTISDTALFDIAFANGA